MILEFTKNIHFTRLIKAAGRLREFNFRKLPDHLFHVDVSDERGNRIIDEAATKAGRDPREIRRLINVPGDIAADDLRLSLRGARPTLSARSPQTRGTIRLQAAAGATLLTPYGWHLLAHLPVMAGQPVALGLVSEFQTPSLHGATGQLLTAYLFLVVLAWVLRKLREQADDVNATSAVGVGPLWRLLYRARADVVLVGISRTSKTPTSIYLANRGIKTANIPVVPGIPLPPQLEAAQRPLIVGLTASPDRIVQLRENRVLSLNAAAHGEAYVDKAAVAGEIAAARKLCARHGWPVIDVTRRSIEETAAAVMKLLAERRRQVVS